MESAKRMKPENEDEEEISLSAFHFPDLTIKVGNEKLFVNRDQLMAESPVFKTMLTGNFKEKNACEIELPDKDPTTFALFLRHTLPVFDGLILSGRKCVSSSILNLKIPENKILIFNRMCKYLEKLVEPTARRILPLAHEYQTNVTLKKIDKALASFTGEKELDKLIDDILEAELFSLPRYLTACIQKARSFSPTLFERNPKFDNITSDTKARIFIMRCKAIESETSKCKMVLEKYVSTYGCIFNDCVNKLKLEKVKTILSQKLLRHN